MNHLSDEIAFGRWQKIGLWIGPILFLLVLFTSPPAGLSQTGWRTAAVAALLSIFWITEAIPIPVTSLLPLALFPLLGIAKIDNAASPYANPLVFLFMGGFIIALAMQRWKLHKRIALTIIKFIGIQPHAIIFGFMIASALLSMWISNTATAMMMLPIGISVIELTLRNEQKLDGPVESNFGRNLMLGIAFGSSIGGLGTLIGTPPNAFLAAFMRQNFGYHIGFLQWMLVGVPLVLIGLPLTYFLLTRVVYPIRLKYLPGGKDFIDMELKNLGAISFPEKMVAIVFALVASLWILNPLVVKIIPGLSDSNIAISGAILLFLIPNIGQKGTFIMNWKSAEKLPWGVLLLFGGGLTLASAIHTSGLAEWIGNSLSTLKFLPILGLILIVTAVVVFLTELTSNTATAAAFLPIMSSVALGIGQNPLLLVIPAALGASCAFMLPVSTPPNAIVFSSGYITIPQMARAGVLVMFMFIFLITILTYTLVLLVFNVQIGVLPTWATGN